MIILLIWTAFTYLFYSPIKQVYNNIHVHYFYELSNFNVYYL